MGDWNFADIYDVVAKEIPDSVALVQGDRKLVWRDLDRRATSIAAFLIAAGLKRQANVTQYLYNCTDYLESIVATFKGAFVPMNTNFRYGPEELTYLWTNGDVEAVIFHGTFVPVIEQMREKVPAVKAWLWVDDGSGPCPDWATPYEEAAAFEAKENWRPWGVSGDDILLLYTGGTTGMPKGVMWRQDDLFIRLNTENGDDYPPEPDVDFLRQHIAKNGRAHLSAGPLMHGAGLLTCFMTLSRGGKISHLTERNFNPVDLLDTIDRDQVASLMWIGDAFARPVLDTLEANPGRWDLSSLRTIISSGVVFSAEVKEGILKHIPKAAIADVFGSSETMSLGRSITMKDKKTKTASFKAKPTTRVIDENDRDIVPGSGEKGLLAIGGRQPIGYYKEPEKTAAVFRQIGGERYVVPGDWATIDADGTITLIGRGSECINTGGEKVFPEEVEVVLKRHDSVFDAVVVGVPNLRFGQSIVAVVQPKKGQTVNGEALIEHVKSQISGYKAPRRVLQVDEIKRGPNGKADLTAIREYAISQVPSS
ncbi:MAG: AMP-binding protein [Flavobacteriaceae bacterium]